MSRRKPIQRAAGAGREGGLLAWEAWRAAVNISGSSCPFLYERSSAVHSACLSGGSVRPPWPTHPPVVRKQNHQEPLSDRSHRKADRKRAPAPYARMVGRPCRAVSGGRTSALV